MRESKESERYSKSNLQYIAKSMIEDLRECDDGTITTTGRLAAEYGYDDMELFDLINLHGILIQTARVNHITLDLSEHKNKLEGLPFNLTFVVRNKKAQIKCPYCGSIETARYIYGYPAFSKEMQEMLDKGKWVLGGCMLDTVKVNGISVDTMPARRCNKCKKNFAKPPLLYKIGNETAEDYRDIVTSVIFSTGGFFPGHTNVTISKNENGASVHVDVVPYGSDSMLSAINVPKDKQITSKKWQQIISMLYDEFYIHEWKKRYNEKECVVMDEEQWKLQITLTGGRKRTIIGDNTYPPYWKELKKMFEKYVKFQ